MAESRLEMATDEEFRRMQDMVFETPIPTPRVVDFEVTGICPYRCEWCWGPEHNVGKSGSLSAKELTRSMELLSLGTMAVQRFVITGGEPTTRPDIAEIVSGSTATSDETVLSTTGDFLANIRRARRLWGVIEDAGSGATIALPLHSSDALASQSLMPSLRVNQAPDRVAIVSGVFRHAQALGNNTTLRTTITSKQDINDLDLIPEKLLERGVDLEALRWKIYEYNPFVGPRTDVIEDYHVAGEIFESIVAEIQAKYSDYFATIDVHRATSSSENYVIIGPDGYIRVVECNSDGLPFERYLRDWKQGELVNLRSDPISALEAITEHMPIDLWDPELLIDDDLPEMQRR